MDTNKTKFLLTEDDQSMYSGKQVNEKNYSRRIGLDKHTNGGNRFQTGV